MADLVMRATMARGTVPSTMVGKIKWRAASMKAPFWPEISESISMNPVTGWK